MPGLRPAIPSQFAPWEQVHPATHSLRLSIVTVAVVDEQTLTIGSKLLSLVKGHTEVA